MTLKLSPVSPEGSRPVTVADELDLGTDAAVDLVLCARSNVAFLLLPSPCPDFDFAMGVCEVRGFETRDRPGQYNCQHYRHVYTKTAHHGSAVVAQA